ncbi:YidH family protein [Pseudomonas veronii]
MTAQQEDLSNAERDDRGRLASRLLAGGSEPDPRFTLANERTFLAWIRTALALLAGGIAVEAFTLDVFTPAVRTTLSVSLLLMAMLISGSACMRWLNVERALRNKAPLPLPLLVPLLSIGGALVTLVLIGVFLLRQVH